MSIRYYFYPFKILLKKTSGVSPRTSRPEIKLLTYWLSISIFVLAGGIWVTRLDKFIRKLDGVDLVSTIALSIKA